VRLGNSVRLATALLALVFVAVLFAGCGKQGPAGDWWESYGQKQKQAREAAMDAYNGPDAEVYQELASIGLVQTTLMEDGKTVVRTYESVSGDGGFSHEFAGTWTQQGEVISITDAYHGTVDYTFGKDAQGNYTLKDRSSMLYRTRELANKHVGEQ